jgi:acetyltransferase-like isoleucine patch superfamily enzyme/acyl carrier protein
MPTAPTDASKASSKTLLAGIWDKFSRDAGRTPLRQLTRKAVRYVSSLALSPLYLRDCSNVGLRARCRGRPYIENHGRITIGDDFNLTSLFVRSHLVTGPYGVMTIGDSVNINFGAAISANERLTIGNRVRVGPYVIIADSDYHSAKDRNIRPTSPIEIGDDVWLASRVVVLKGAQIGPGSVITAGSVVSGVIPAHVIAGGVPARVLRRIGTDERTEADWSDELQAPYSSVETQPIRDTALPVDVLDVLNQPEEGLLERVSTLLIDTFQLSGPPEPNWGPKEIARWDSLGQLQLTTALEAQFGISLTERDMMRMTNVEQVVRIVSRCLNRAKQPAP